MRRTCFWIVAFSFTAGRWALGDISFEPRADGKSIAPGKDAEGVMVEMAGEEVRLHLVKGAGGHDRLEVTAVFFMRNHGPAATFETGFPVGPEKLYESFSVKIDGKPVSADLVDRKVNEARGRKKAPRDWWYVWQAAYPGQADSRHEVRYTARLARSGEGGAAGYQLATGAGWKGPIGRATVILTFGSGFSPDHIRSVRPEKGARREKDRYVWDLSSLDPKAEDDIAIRYSARSYQELLRDARRAAKASWNHLGVVLSLLECRPAEFLRTKMAPEELGEYLDTLDALLAGAKDQGGALVLPVQDAGGEKRSYLYSPEFLLKWIDGAARAAEANPESERARAVLGRFVDLGERFRAGRVKAGGQVLEFRDGPIDGRLMDQFERRMEKARETLRQVEHRPS